MKDGRVNNIVSLFWKKLELLKTKVIAKYIELLYLNNFIKKICKYYQSPELIDNFSKTSSPILSFNLNTALFILAFCTFLLI